MANTFQASVQYDDWEGTCAADDHGQQDIFRLLQAKGLIKKGQLPVGITAYIGENQGSKVESPYVEVLFIDQGNYDAAVAALKAAKDPLALKVERFELTMDKFFGLFKRFSIYISRKGLDLTGREYETN